MNAASDAKTAPSTQAESELSARLQLAISKAQQANRNFFVVVLQIENMTQYRKRRPEQVVNNLFRELYSSVRKAVHPSQFVSIYQNGLVLVFDSVDVGQVDTVSRRLASLAQNVIRAGHYNDLTSRWTDILTEFLFPQKPSVLFSRVGWGIYPRDGQSGADLLRRAVNHVAELAR